MPSPTIRRKRIHKKSKRGCRTCKRRRVKCDETNFPTCENCTRRSIECDWPPVYAPSPPSREEPRTGMLSMQLRFQPVCTQGYDNSDLELIHHYTTCTVHTLLDVYGIRSPDVLMMYQCRTPRLAFGHPFLMHAILSFASLHLLWLNKNNAPSTSRQYYVLSCYHRSQAVLSYNAKDFTSHLCSSSCTCIEVSEAQFLTNLLLSLHVVCDSNLAMPDEVHPELRMLHWFRTGKSSMDRLYCTKRGGMLIGPFSPASSQGQGPSVYFPSPSPTLSKPTQSPFISLSPLIYSIHLPDSGAPDDRELLYPEPANTAQVYADVVHSIHVCYRLFFERNAPLRAILGWFMSLMPPEWQQFIVERRPRARILLAHITVLQKWCDFQGASWWKSHSGLIQLSRNRLPDDGWRAFMDETLKFVGHN
ncbi:hypothetical protein DL96DRAFT_246883 [Flagelloscypha sp. PMI_526]|nr:hypothetical protein DL96DRAFT_246883 [Flagelloscypha sp. PMI_526]